jgi:hypothetical protein
MIDVAMEYLVTGHNAELYRHPRARITNTSIAPVPIERENLVSGMINTLITARVNGRE